MDLLTIILIVVLLIIVYNYFFNPQSDNFTTNNKTVYIFISKTCPHCVSYMSGVHDELSNYLKKKNINLNLVYSDNDPNNLFSKYNVEYVPTCIVVGDNEKVQKLNGEISIDNVNALI
jgi:thiol-disulfide isomerase/thioredoxin